jgi:hypothetical protein
MNEAIVPWMWQTIRRPIHVHEQIVAAINKAKSGGTLCARD